MRAFRVAYDGRPFYGFQRQPSVPTVEDTFFDALRKLDLLDDDADKPTGYAAAGRTDAGVSAVAQTMAFECPEWCTPRALNSELPKTVRAWAAADVADDFHATHDAARRRYSYHLYAPRTTNETNVGVVDDEAVRAAVADLRGRHDFHNLTPDERGTVRTVDIEVERDGEFLVIRVEAGGFARELVRRLVSLLHAVGTGDAPHSKIATVLGPAPIDGPDGVPSAPPTPLVLAAVEYPGVVFDVDSDAAASADEVFRAQSVAGRVTTRVADEIRAGIGGGPGPRGVDE